MLITLEHVSDASQGRIVDLLWGDNNVLYVAQGEYRYTQFFFSENKL